MHEQKRLVVAAVLAALGGSGPAAAQNDAAQKAQEGGIDHWIEYYKNERRKSAENLPAPPADPSAPSTTTDAPASPHGSATGQPQELSPK